MVVAAKQTEGGFGGVFVASAMREKSRKTPSASLRSAPPPQAWGRRQEWEMNLVASFSPGGEGGSWGWVNTWKTSFAEDGRRRALKITHYRSGLGV